MQPLVHHQVMGTMDRCLTYLYVPSLWKACGPSGPSTVRGIQDTVRLAGRPEPSGSGLSGGRRVLMTGLTVERSAHNHKLVLTIQG